MKIPKIITLSGIDGAGKTSTAQILKKYFEKKGLSVYVAHVGGGFGGVSTNIGLFTYLKDYIQIVFHYIHSIGKYDIIIFDRFLYDTQVKIAYKNNNKLPRLFFFPLKHIAFHLTLPHEISFSRDTQHSKEYHVKKIMLYNKLKKHFNLVQIDSQKPKNNILKEMMKYF